MGDGALWSGFRCLWLHSFPAGSDEIAVWETGLCLTLFTKQPCPVQVLLYFGVISDGKIYKKNNFHAPCI